MQKHIRFDWAVKKILRSKANYGILEGFLRELLKEEITIQEILESEGNMESEKDKFNRVDILVKDSTDRLIIVEIQNTREIDYFYKILYNSAKVITEYISLGDKYSNVKKIITVSLVYFNLGQGEDYVYHGTTSFKGVHKEDTLELSNAQKKLFNRKSLSDIFPDHYVIKVNEFDDNARDSLDQWIYFFKNSVIKDEFNAEGLAEAREKLKEIKMSEKELAHYKRHLENMMTEAGIAETFRFEKEFARSEGREEGLEEGLEKGVRKTARAMKKNNVPIDQITLYTGLSKEEIEALE